MVAAVVVENLASCNASTPAAAMQAATMRLVQTGSPMRILSVLPEALARDRDVGLGWGRLRSHVAPRRPPYGLPLVLVDRAQEGRPRFAPQPALPLPLLPPHLHRPDHHPVRGPPLAPRRHRHRRALVLAVPRLSAANVRDLLAERNIDVSARCVLRWVQKFG